MKLWKSFHRQKMGVRPHQIIFEKENTENTYITWEDKMKPRIDVDDGVTMEEYRAMAARWEEMLSLAEEIVWRNYLNPKSDDLMSGVDSFPDILRLTGDENGEERDYMGLDLITEFVKLDDPLEFEILSHDVI